MKGSYQFENLESRHLEASFLAERAQLRLEGFVDLLRRHGFPPRGRVLEVGCAQGVRTRLMAEAFPDADIVGIDRSPELLQSAREANGFAHLSFQQADLYELPFAEESFDFVYARLVFMHLKDPGEAIRCLRKVLRPGGRLLIEDADRDCMFFEPAPDSFANFWAKVQAGQRRLGGDPNIGRKLAPYLLQEGYVEVKTELQPITGGGRDIAFLARTLLPSLNIYLAPEDRAGGASAIDDLRCLAENPCAAFYHIWFVVSGEKPAVTAG
jgi:SAM-dependent methyltransferase